MQKAKQQLASKEEELRKFSLYNDSHIVALTHERNALKLEREQIKTSLQAKVNELQEELAEAGKGVREAGHKDKQLAEMALEMSRLKEELETARARVKREFDHKEVQTDFDGKQQVIEIKVTRPPLKKDKRKNLQVEIPTQDKEN